MKAAVLGAYGAVGRRLAVEAATLGHVVTAVGRDGTRLSGVPAHDHLRLSMTDLAGVRRMAAAHDVVVNATGVEDSQLALASTEGGAAFMDISAECDYLGELSRLAPVRPIAAGIGLAPGLTNLLAVAASGEGPLHIGIIAGIGEPHGDAARAWVWSVSGRQVTSGGTTQRVYRTARRFDVPGLGRRTLLRAGFGEQDQLATSLDRPVSTWLGFDPAWATALLAVAGIAPGAAAYLDRLSGPAATLLAQRDRWTVVVSEATSTRAWATGRREVDATATVAALLLERLATAPPGVYAADELARLDDVREGLSRAGIEVATNPSITENRKDPR
ncbi:hypothetical protein ABN034_30490 [Actinopolymorpha sp. B11F2]|uniref:hypothetical protein n=1 Tax=Actinopolymorpha sp. B11F2 TaxID=3160862 RepID=UPI0032E43FBD